VFAKGKKKFFLIEIKTNSFFVLSLFFFTGTSNWLFVSEPWQVQCKKSCPKFPILIIIISLSPRWSMKNENFCFTTFIFKRYIHSLVLQFLLFKTKYIEMFTLTLLLLSFMFNFQLVDQRIFFAKLSMVWNYISIKPLEMFCYIGSNDNNMLIWENNIQIKNHLKYMVENIYYDYLVRPSIFFLRLIQYKFIIYVIFTIIHFISFFVWRGKMFSSTTAINRSYQYGSRRCKYS